MATAIGSMRERITLQEEVRTEDGAGGFTTSWADLSFTPSVWARVEPLEGRERLQAMQVDARASHRVTVRYRSDLKASQRIVWRSRHLHPIGPWLNEDERRRFATAMCREDTD